MANKSLSSMTSLLKKLRPFSSGTHVTSFMHQECSWSKVRALHTSCQVVASAHVSVGSSPTEAKTKELVLPDRLIWKMEVHCQGHDRAVMQSYKKFLQMTCQHLGINAGPAVHGTPSHERITLLKSVHIHGKHRVQYEMQTYPLDLTVYHLTGSTADTFLEYIQRMCPEGVMMRVTEHTLNKFPASVMQVLSDARARNGDPIAEAGGAAEARSAVARGGDAAAEAGDAVAEVDERIL
ncbi:Ribosomal protein S10 domain [Trinorchestia longiramus]|nr:Ribosomal protein S10 domain [Trinorchestia longiramus]